MDSEKTCNVIEELPEDTFLSSSPPPLAVVFLILISGFLVYANTFQVPFLFDDNGSIINNPVIKSLDNFIGSTEGYDYNPRRAIGYLSFTLNYHFGKLNVTGYHIVNLIIHLVNGLIIYALLRLTLQTQLFKTRPSAFIPLFTALLFVIHPVQTQAVTYIVQRLTSLAVFFYLLSILLYVQARVRFDVPGENDVGLGALDSGRKHKVWRGRLTPLLFLMGATFSAILAMSTKEISFTLPLAVLLYEACFFQGKWKRRLLYLLPILLTLPIIPLSVLTASESAGDLLTDVSEKARVDVAIPRLHYFFTQFRVIVTYLRLLLLPINQNLDYDYPVYTNFFVPSVFFAFLLLAILFILAVYLYFISRPVFTLTQRPLIWKTDPAVRIISFGLFWFFLALSVESSLIPINDIIFEHRLYLPSVGMFMALAALTTLLPLKRRKMALGILTAVIVLVLGMATWKRNLVWQSPVTLWQDVTIKSPNKARPYINLGAELGKAGRLDEAIVALTKATRIQPENVEPYANLGAALASAGRNAEAVRVLSQAVRIDPENPDVLNNLGIVLKDVGRSEEAIAALAKAVRIRPDHARAWYNLGRTLLLVDRQSEGVAALQRAVLTEPDYDNAAVELAAVLNRERRYSESLSLLNSKLLRLGNRPDARFVLGLAAHCLGDFTIANRELAALQRLDFQQARQLANLMSRSCNE